MEILALDNEIQSKAREQMSDQQRDYYLREQMKAIQNELGEGDGADEFEEYRQKIAKAALPDEVREKLTKELNRLTKQPFGSSEATYVWSCLGENTPRRRSVSRLSAGCWTRSTTAWIR